MAERPRYTEIEHTADVGIELTAPDVRSAFELAAAAMFDMISDLTHVRDESCQVVRVHGRPGDLPNLMVRWLSELLYFFEGEGLLLCSFRIDELGGGAIAATVGGEPWDPKRHVLKTEIKAATYHDLEIDEVEGAWRVRVIFDT